MKSSFSRVFTAVIIVLLAALLLVGISFQLLARDFLTDTAVEELKSDADVIAQIAQASYSDGSLNGHDFAVALSVATEVTGHDTIIFDHEGTLLVCSDSPLGCEHQGMALGGEYFQRIVSEGCAVDTCVLTGIYEDQRFVVAMPFSEERSGRVLGIVMVSSPYETTRLILSRISDIFLYVSLLVVLLSLVLTIMVARQQSTPLKAMADAARAFGHGDLTARVKVEDNGSLELRELALAFNNMASSLQKVSTEGRNLWRMCPTS